MKGKLPRKSFFTRVLVSYLCFVLISLISSVVIYRLASTRLIEKTTSSDYAAFRQFYEVVDQELRNAADKVTELSQDYSGFLTLLEKASAKSASGYRQREDGTVRLCQQSLTNFFSRSEKSAAAFLFSYL